MGPHPDVVRITLELTGAAGELDGENLRRVAIAAMKKEADRLRGELRQVEGLIGGLE